jgi:catechol 2,3-dioxygenase-like lactoylglutathione lyase family enzyme
MLNKVHHVGYVVPDIDEIAAYLEKYFGLQPVGVAEPPGWGFKSLLFQVGETEMEFAQPIVDEHGEAVVRREPAMMFAKQLRETGPGLTHVAWGVDGIEEIFRDLQGRGLKFDTTGGHATAVHSSVVGGYNVLNIHPKHVGPAYEHSAHGVFFQLAEGEIVDMPGWKPYKKK